MISFLIVKKEFDNKNELNLELGVVALLCCSPCFADVFGNMKNWLFYSEKKKKDCFSAGGKYSNNNKNMVIILKSQKRFKIFLNITKFKL